ncbi:glycosyltransferase family 22 protein [Pseudocercospora fijiensis CIRAD86]|uniref:Mannosyltransferase n=1 Tax=Pseudocercospora fijiensis (strain CIRAD86) TaxID=383855 RepID=M3AY51_PSEFD|nr:glycosyltransferase family 22 protein [Pseudocercospora fijiensis CIRAD86]EME82088.1 glycosyltransferase family 22 protein [Pseudocercospora fijiensis CIRAD86]
MWRRLYLLLVLLRLYFALQPSYIHPDEHFQGPEIIAGEVFGYPIYKTWEFTSSYPIRSIFPFWLVYGWPLTVLKWIWEGLGYGPVPPSVAFYTLRCLMFLMSFILGDWAIHELVPIPNERRRAIMLVASSYVTWTLQTHTFSNSIETIAVLWSLVLIRRLSNDPEQLLVQPCAGLAFLAVVGVFNRITFPAYLLLPLLQLLPSLLKRPLRIPVMLFSGLATMAIAITMDTEFYQGYRPHVRDLLKTAVFTPWNNLTYNTDVANLSQHGLHPFWQHFVANLPQLIGPAIPLLFLWSRKDILLWSAVSGTIALSLFPHQEPRFLLPAVPLLLATTALPPRGARYWVAIWIFFNALAAVLFGQYHQGGVVPAQNWIAQQEAVSQAFWWKTYSPPRWLLDGRNHYMETLDLMGMSGDKMIAQLKQSAHCESAANKTLLVAPDSATFLDAHTWPSSESKDLTFLKMWQYRKHIGLDDLDFGGDGVKPTLQRVVGRRGLVVWQVSRKC